MDLSEQLGAAIATPPLPAEGAVDPLMRSDGLIVKVARLRHDAYPGRDARGVLPVFVVGHEGMDEADWRDWVREHGIAHYGAGYTERVIRDGIDLKEMCPTSGFGRHMRAGINGQGASSGYGAYPLRQAESLITAAEKWPGIYNLIADEMAEQEMTLREFLDKVRNLPAPWELGAGAETTLGDLVGPPLHSAFPNF